MDNRDRALLAQVQELVRQERALRERLADPADRHRIDERAALHDLEEELDQCWDLLRQRRALEAVDLDPDSAQVRPVAQVENYLPRPEGRL
jgi:hypothetical protein